MSVLFSLINLFVLLVLASLFFRIGLFLLRIILRRREFRETLQPAGDPTRFALASLWLEGGRFRRSVLDLDRELCRARAPEIGIDVELVVSACRKIDAFCTRRNAIILLALFLAVPVLMTGGSVLGLTMLSSQVPTLAFVSSVAFLALCGFTLWSIWRDDFVHAREFSRERFDRDEARLKYVVSGAEGIESFPPGGNIICFGSTNPFVGFGSPAGAWQMATSLGPAGDETPQPLTSESLHEAIARSVKTVGVKNLTAKDFVFMNGTEVAHVAKQENLRKAFLPDPFGRPRTAIAAQGIHYFRANPDDRVRPYACFSIANWGMEVVTNCFVRALVEGNSASIEMVTTVLLPVDRSYRKIDELSRPGKLGAVLWFLQVLPRVPLYWLDAIYSIAVFIRQRIKDGFKLDQFRTHREIRLNPAYNYGATDTIRGMISSDSPHFYFQRADIRRAREVMGKAVLEAVIGAMRDAGYSTRDFELQAPMLIDNSIYVSAGGDLDISGAIGRGASVMRQTAATITEKLR
ncbi:hypothetical protein LL06_01065 [Hoeflea sp. BAL378]|nr:hypothetical protein LL06_01065 [Hoeflea sp. BAL378]